LADRGAERDCELHHVGMLVTKGQPWSLTFPHFVEFNIEELSVSQPWR
jgi:hypothetical protein